MDAQLDLLPTGPPPPPPDVGRAVGTDAVLRGKVRKLVYGRDGFRIWRITAGQIEGARCPFPDPVSFKCSMKSGFDLELAPGEGFEAHGKWTEWKGMATFDARVLVREVPRDVQGFLSWVVSGAVPGVGKASAERIAGHWGEGVLSVVHDPDRLQEAGVSAKIARKVADKWNETNGQAARIAFMGSLGLGKAAVSRLVDRYGDTAEDVVRANPWKLAETIPGIGFDTADAVSVRLGASRDDPMRIAAGLRAALVETVQVDGNAGVPADDLLRLGARLLNLPSDDLRPVLTEAIRSGGLVEDPSGLVMPPFMVAAERDVAAALSRLSGGGVSPDAAARAVDEAEAARGVTLDEGQREAARVAMTAGVSVVTGGPGTGKTTLQSVVVDALVRCGRKVALAAPTARAAKRLEQAVGRPAATVHRLLKFRADGGRGHGAGDPLEADWFVVDEASMLDVSVAAAFLTSVPDGAGVTFVGDVDQLPSVGAGLVLADLIGSGVVPTVRLGHVYRQADGGGIVAAAHRINRGIWPLEGGRDRTHGFAVLDVADPEAIVRRVVTLATDVLPSKGLDPLTDVQVMAAVRRGPCGVDDLNKAIKRAVNPRPGVTVSGHVLSTGDRVMQTVNDYGRKVFNGEVGVVAGVGPDGDWLDVDFGRDPVRYRPGQFGDLDPAWACTVHKCQGMEYPAVLVAVPEGHGFMLARNVIYTAVTRAKRLCVVVGPHETVRKAISGPAGSSRGTALRRRLVEAYGEGGGYAVPPVVRTSPTDGGDLFYRPAA